MANPKKANQEAKTLLAINLHKYMIANGLNQKELADKIGIKENTMSGYMSGRRYPELNTLRKIAQMLDCQVPNLTGEAVDNAKSVDITPPMEYQMLNSDDRLIIDAFIRELYRIHQS